MTTISVPWVWMGQGGGEILICPHHGTLPSLLQFHLIESLENPWTQEMLATGDDFSTTIEFTIYAANQMSQAAHPGW